MKNIIVATLTLFIIGLMAFTASQGRAYHGGEHGKVIENIGSNENTQSQKVSQPEDKSDREKESEQLQALKDKAGNVGEIKVSDAYKSRCSACHGVNGSGVQDGKKLMGPKLYGQDSEKLYKDLIDFKAGRKENVIMKGLLINITEDQLRVYADEIGAFSSQVQE